MACALIAQALDAGAPCAWVLADALYGTDSRLRRMLEKREQPYVLAVRSNCQRALNAPQFGACKIPHLAGPAISREFDGQLHSWVVGRAAEVAASWAAAG